MCFNCLLTVRTACCRLPVVATPEQVYNSVDADTVLTVLTHKITRAVRAQVGQQGRIITAVLH